MTCPLDDCFILIFSPFSTGTGYKGACPFYLFSNQQKGNEMPIYKRCDRCHKRIPAGTTCDCIKSRRRGDRADKETVKEYGTARWKVKREKIMNLYCHMDALLYFRDRLIVPAEMIHHIEPLKERPDLWLDDDNLIPLSNATHAEVERNYSASIESKCQQQEELRAAQMYLKEILHCADEDME